MSSRALSLAAVMLLIGCLAAASAQAENLDAGKTASQIFAGTCSECHKSSRGLLRKVPAGSLPGFLRQHYTTGGQMAAVLSAYLIANGAADRRLPPPDGQPKPGTDAKPDAEPRQATRPDADGSSPQVDRRGRRRLVRPGEAPDAAKPGDDVPAQSASERGPDGRRLRRGRPGSEELPKTDAAKTDTSKIDTSKTDTSKTDAAKTDAAKTDTSKTDAAKTDAARDEPSKGEPAKDVKPSSETAKGEDGKPEGSKPSGDGRSEAAKEAVKIDAPKATGEPPVLRADPVPPVTPAPAVAPAPPAAAANAVPERTPEPPPAPAAPSEPPSVTASAPPPAPAGPPAPPISQ
jgi:hypothetical protein